MNQLNRNITLIAWAILYAVLLAGFSSRDLPLNDVDQKKLDKARKLKQDAQKYMDKANALYSEVASDTENEKKAERLKDKALDYQLKVVALQNEANLLKYEVYKHVIAQLKTSTATSKAINTETKLLRESAEALFYKSEVLRGEAANVDKEQKETRLTKLNTAQEYEKSALEKLEQIIDACLHNYKPGSPVKSNNQDTLVIKKELLDVYLKYLEQTDSVLTHDRIKKIALSDTLSSSNFRNAWENYIYADEQQPETPVPSDSTEQARVVAEDIQEQEAELPGTGEQAKPTSDREIFKLEIAADKKPISQSTLQKIYQEKKKVKMTNEEGWKKYTIGDFDSFADAEKFKNAIGIDEAFVVGYKNGIRVTASIIKTSDKRELTAEETAEKKERQKRETAGEEDKTASKSPEKAAIGTSNIIFKVQIAAHRQGLPDEKLRNIYSGDENIDIIKEEGWTKYSIGKFSDYQQAARLKNSVDVDGAFVVAYRDGVKVPLYLARKNKQQYAKPIQAPETFENIEYKVQIAANAKPLSSEKVHKIYSGYEEVAHFEEDQWHKYAIGSFKTFREANELRKSSGVKGAFVIAFANGEKINVLKAKKKEGPCEPKVIQSWLEKSDQITFRVQIAASMMELSSKGINKIYCTDANVYLYREDGWYKYAIGNFKNYRDAEELRKSANIGGSFIVAFRNGKRINLKEAIRLSEK
jgi:hypothetical protein